MAVSRTGVTTVLAAAAVALPLSLGGLAPQAHAQTSSPSPAPTGTGSPSPTATGTGSPSPSPTATATGSPSPTATGTGSPSPTATGTGTGTPTPGAGIFGPGCSALPATGPGSAAVMAHQRLVAAASGNPQLSTLVAYINRAKIANLLDTTNNITLFAPTNDAWKKLSSTQRSTLLTNPTQLKKVLNYHVVPQHITKAELPNGSFTTREGAKLTTSGSGNTFKVNNTANIVCGNIPTLNATVYLVDTVLMPPS